jgi:hypothetical protein
LLRSSVVDLFPAACAQCGRAAGGRLHGVHDRAAKGLLLQNVESRNGGAAAGRDAGNLSNLLMFEGDEPLSEIVWGEARTPAWHRWGSRYDCSPQPTPECLTRRRGHRGVPGTGVPGTVYSIGVPGTVYSIIIFTVGIFREFRVGAEGTLLFIFLICSIEK